MEQLKSFAKKVGVMREFQKQYYKLSGRARNDKSLWGQAQTALRYSKAMEKEVDTAINEILEKEVQ